MAKKETRIVAALKGIMNTTIAKNRVKAFNNAIEAARLNAELELNQAEDRCIESLKRLSDTDTMPSEIVQDVYNFIMKRNEINEGLKAFKEVEKYINEEVEIDE